MAWRVRRTDDADQAESGKRCGGNVETRKMVQVLVDRIRHHSPEETRSPFVRNRTRNVGTIPAVLMETREEALYIRGEKISDLL